MTEGAVAEYQDGSIGHRGRMVRTLLTAVMGLGMAACNTSPSEALLGPWRSDGFNMLVTADSTAVWGNCSTGTIPGRLAVDAVGRFQATFDYRFTPGIPGGARVDRLLLTGQLHGNELEVSLDAMGGAPPLNYRLERGPGMPYLPCPTFSPGSPTP